MLIAWLIYSTAQQKPESPRGARLLRELMKCQYRSKPFCCDAQVEMKTFNCNVDWISPPHPNLQLKRSAKANDVWPMFRLYEQRNQWLHFPDHDMNISFLLNPGTSRRQRPGKVQLCFPSRSPGALQYNVPHIVPLRYSLKSSKSGTRILLFLPCFVFHSLHLKAVTASDDSSSQLWGRGAATSSSFADSGTKR